MDRTYLASDVEKVADALIESAYEMDTSDSYMYGYYQCQHCFNYSQTEYEQDVVHGKDCEVLIAHDLLTNRITKRDE